MLRESTEFAIAGAETEDTVFAQMDKLLALCAIQAVLESSDVDLPREIRSNYSRQVEEQALVLRKTLVRVFQGKGER